MTTRDSSDDQPFVADLLFTDGLPQMDDEVGYRGAVAARAAGITYRQLDYWARTELVEPTVRGASRIRFAAPVRLPRHPGAQARQAPARHRHLTAADPHRRRAAAVIRHPGSRRHDPHERRRVRLPVHLERRGHRPRQPWAGRVRHRRRKGAERGGVDARRLRRAVARLRVDELRLARAARTPDPAQPAGSLEIARTAAATAAPKRFVPSRADLGLRTSRDSCESVLAR